MFKLLYSAGHKSATRIQHKDGQVYKAVSTGKDSCTGCAFDHMNSLCIRVPVACTPLYRADGRTIIWIKESS